MLTATHRAPPTTEAAVSASATRVGDMAGAALLAELEAWPKPGLVSHRDSGSHRDMDARSFTRSARALRPFFARLADAGARRASMAELRAIGVAAERAMMVATGGVNAHRGAIFSIGLLCAAIGWLGYARVAAEAVAGTVADAWGDAILAERPSPRSHGGLAARRHSVGGAAVEAALGFPTVCRVALPALRDGRRLRPDDPMAHRVQCLFGAMSVLDDTNLLHRGGADGLAWAKATAAGFLAAGGVGRDGWRAEAERLHRCFVARNLSPGGSADLLAIALFLDDFASERAA